MLTFESISATAGAFRWRPAASTRNGQLAALLHADRLRGRDPDLSLAVLGAGEEDIKLLRNRMVGTPTMTGERGSPEQWGEAAMAFLEGVAAHGSKASEGYYTKYFLQYYAGMWSSLGELRRVMRYGAPAILVVQDNYYKDLHNDTAKILSEMARALDFESVTRQDFPVVRNRASMNPRARQYRTKASAVESILVLR